MLKDTEIQAIISMLDDTDEEIVQVLENRLFQEGPDIIPSLEDFWTRNHDPVKAYRLELIIRKIQENALIQDMTVWAADGKNDLFDGSILVARIQYPGLNVSLVQAWFEKVRLDSWMAMYSAFNPFDKIQILNHILFERQGLSGNTESYHAPENSFINKVIDHRKGNPISLSIIYSIIAQRLGIPVFGVNLPQHFVLAYCDDSEKEQNSSFHSEGELNRADYGKVLFYINPFSSGQIFLRKNIDDFLKAIKVEPRDSFFEACSNMEIIQRVLRNLEFAYTENHNTEKVELVAKCMSVVQNP